MAFINAYRPPSNLINSYLQDSVEPYDINFCLPLSPTLESTRVLLTPFIPAVHGELFFNAFHSAPELGRYLPISFPSYLDFLEFVEGVRSDPNSILFVIIDKTKLNEGLKYCLAGIIGFLNTSKANRATEIAPVIILPAFQRTFVATNAVGLILQCSLDVPSAGGLGFRRVYWTAHQDNLASVKAAERMGMKREGYLRWTWVTALDKIGKECGEGRGEGLGRDSVLLAICWDDWENGAKEQVARLIDRV